MTYDNALSKILLEMHKGKALTNREEDELRFYFSLMYGMGFDEGRLQRSHRKPVCRIDKTGKINRIFDSAVVAARVSGVPPSNIYDAVAGKQHTAAGFYWRYARKNEI